MDKLVYSVNPTLGEVTTALKMLRGYVEFRYKPLPECRVQLTPSKAAALAFTLYPKKRSEWGIVKGYLGEDSFFKTHDGNFCIRLRNMKRKVIGNILDLITGEVVEYSYFADKSNRQEDGTRKIGFDDGEYLFRAFRLDVRNDGFGIDLASVHINMGRALGKQRLFPNASPNIRDTAGEAINERTKQDKPAPAESEIFEGNPRHSCRCFCIDCLGKKGGMPTT